MKKIIQILASIAILSNASTIVYADDILEQNYIVDTIWSDWWLGQGDNGQVFPEASYKYHLLSNWIATNYGNDDFDWNNIDELSYDFSEYYSDLTEHWDFEDDNNGNWMIITEDTVYHFTLDNGKWMMIDEF